MLLVPVSVDEIRLNENLNLDNIRLIIAINWPEVTLLFTIKNRWGEERRGCYYIPPPFHLYLLKAEIHLLFKWNMFSFDVYLSISPLHFLNSHQRLLSSFFFFFFSPNCQIFKFLVSVGVTGFISNTHLHIVVYQHRGSQLSHLTSLYCFQTTVSTLVPVRSSGTPSWFHQLEISSQSPASNYI